MIARSDLRAIAHGRLNDATVLFRAGRYDGSVYLCGYAIEMALKSRVCRTLRWPGYPASRSEFDQLGLRSFQTHDFDVLRRLSGVEARVRTQLLAEWSTASTWDPEIRYRPVGFASAVAAREMLSAARTLLRAL